MWISNKVLLGLILASVACSSVAQLLLKLGMVNAAYARASEARDWAGMAAAALLNPLVIGGLSLYFAGAIVWLMVLAKADLSYAYPFVGLGFILSLALGFVVLHEPVTLQRVAGTVLIALGAVLVAGTASAR
jgi:drug/metabolite transporter (DMT)-like permease